MTNNNEAKKIGDYIYEINRSAMSLGYWFTLLTSSYGSELVKNYNNGKKETVATLAGEGSLSEVKGLLA